MSTMKDVARICGVSTATVSKALNGYPDVGEKTREKVKQVALELGYSPNSIARALKTNRSHNLGVLFIDSTNSGLSHEYFSVILESFKSAAESFGYDVTFITKNLGGKPMTYLEHCHYRCYDAVMIASVNFEDSQVLQLVNSSVPIITIDYLFNNRSSIMSDNVTDMRKLVNYIHSMGHRKIAYIHGEDTSVTQKRLAGFYLECKELGIDVDENYIKMAKYHDPKSSAVATEILLNLKEPPTCIIYPDDFSYIGGKNIIEEHNLKIPEDISVAGYDGIYLSQAMHPKLTTIKQNAKRIGQQAAKKLINSIKEPKTSFPEQIIISGDLLKGQTIKKLL